MAPIISLDSPVEIMSPGLDEGLVCNSIFIGACSDIGLRHFNTFRMNLRSNRSSEEVFSQIETEETIGLSQY